MYNIQYTFYKTQYCKEVFSVGGRRPSKFDDLCTIVRVRAGLQIDFMQTMKFVSKVLKSRIRETLNLSTDADHRTNIYIYIYFFLGGGVKKRKEEKKYM